MAHQPLAGIRVVELGGTLTAAGATKVFADYGAEVVKVEPPGGAAMRRLGPFPDDVPSIETGAYHLAMDANKRSVAIDLETASGEALLDELVGSGVDLVIADLPPGRFAELVPDPGAGGPSTVSITAHGEDGPYRDRAEVDLTLFAYTTRMYHHAIVGREPLTYGPYVPGLQVASTAAMAGLAAVFGRRGDGVRREVAVAAVEAHTANVDCWFVSYLFSGATQARGGAAGPQIFPNGTFECSDGAVLISASFDPFFGRLCEAIGHPEIPRQPAYANPVSRLEQRDAFMDGLLLPWLRQRTKQQAFEELEAHGVMAAPVLSVPEAIDDPQARARGSFVETEHPLAGKVTVAGPPFRLDDAWRLLRPAPQLGEYTLELLAELGYSRPEVLALFRAGVIG